MGPKAHDGKCITLMPVKCLCKVWGPDPTQNLNLYFIQFWPLCFAIQTTFHSSTALSYHHDEHAAHSNSTEHGEGALQSQALRFEFEVPFLWPFGPGHEHTETEHAEDHETYATSPSGGETHDDTSGTHAPIHDDHTTHAPGHDDHTTHAPGHDGTTTHAPGHDGTHSHGEDTMVCCWDSTHSLKMCAEQHQSTHCIMSFGDRKGPPPFVDRSCFGRCVFSQDIQFSVHRGHGFLFIRRHAHGPTESLNHCVKHNSIPQIF